MNKSIIASFIAAACIISAPALAATTTTNRASNTSIQSRVNQAQSIVDQNSATNTVPSFNWADRISIGGQGNFDAYVGSRTPTGTLAPFLGAGSSKHSSDININNLNLFVDAKVNPWMKAHINFAYVGDINRGFDAFAGSDKLNTKVSAPSSFDVDEVYVNFGNFAQTPFYARLGKQYPGFGDYDRYPIITPLTQYLSETRATAATVGAVTDMGFYFNASAFNGPTTTNNKNDNNIDNFTTKVGYFGTVHNFNQQDAHYNVDISWINNIYDTDYIAPLYGVTIPGLPFGTTSYPDKVGGLALHGDVDYGPFSFWANYVGALKKLKMKGPLPLITGGSSACGRLWAADVDGSYKFMTMNKNSKVTASYQFSGNGDDFLNGTPTGFYFPIPHYRFQLGYDVNVWRFVDLGAAWAHDWGYKGNNTGKRQGDQLVGRLSVDF